jgi:serine-type D-Ala-D-Ala carboxypeptidase (penicillin-binding protein 5/6)
VILDAKEDRFAASIRALEYGFAAYDRVNLVAEGKQYTWADVPYRRGETVDLVAKENVDGERVGVSPLVARKGYEEASLWERVWYTVGGIFRVE